MCLAEVSGCTAARSRGPVIDWRAASLWFFSGVGTLFSVSFYLVVRWEYQTTLHVSWETCLQVRKQQLELDLVLLKESESVSRPVVSDSLPLYGL